MKNFLCLAINPKYYRERNLSEVTGMVEEMGMTNEQYKGMLLDELEDWEEVLALTQDSDNDKIIKKAKKQIEKINEKLKF